MDGSMVFLDGWMDGSVCPHLLALYSNKAVGWVCFPLRFKSWILNTKPDLKDREKVKK